MSTDVKTALGRMIRLLREAEGLSQEKLAERAGITYQYLSAVENGKENFTVGILESVSIALGLQFPDLIVRAFADENLPPTVKDDFFIQEAPLPPGLTIPGIKSALNETHKIIRLINATLRNVSGRPLSSYIQGNNFSGIVSNILCDSFSRFTPFKHNHDQRYPDLVNKGVNDVTLAGLEVKTTIRPGKGGESHNGHSGWHVVACYALDQESGDIRFIHVMFAYLHGHDRDDADWKYVGSKVNEETGSQRTETYVTTGGGTAKLRHGSVYLDTDKVHFARWRTSPQVAIPAHSPFAKRVKGNSK
jgi:transcriptional regulator with XRE-family HTH domain